MRAITTYAFPPVRDASFEPLVEALDEAMAGRPRQWKADDAEQPDAVDHEKV